MQIECLTEPVLTTFLLCSWAVLPVKVEVIMVPRCCKRTKKVGKVLAGQICPQVTTIAVLNNWCGRGPLKFDDAQCCGL